MRDEAHRVIDETARWANLLRRRRLPRPGAGDYLRPADERGAGERGSGEMMKGIPLSSRLVRVVCLL